MDDDEMEIDDTIPANTAIIETPFTGPKEKSRKSHDSKEDAVKVTQNSFCDEVENSITDDKAAEVGKCGNDKSKFQFETKPTSIENQEAESSSDNTVSIQCNGTEKERSAIVNLDDDDVEIIDLVGQQRGSSQCINYACKSGVNLQVANGISLSHYRLKGGGRAPKYVCEACYNLALDKYEWYANELIRGGLLFRPDSPMRCELFEIDDSDDDEATADGSISSLDTDSTQLPRFENENLEFLKKHLDTVLINQLEKCNINGHMRKEEVALRERIDRNLESQTRLMEDAKRVRQTLDNIQRCLYNEFRVPQLETAVITIIDDDQFISAPLVHTDVSRVSSDQQLQQQKPTRDISAENAHLIKQLANSRIQKVPGAQSVAEAKVKSPKNPSASSPIKEALLPGHTNAPQTGGRVVAVNKPASVQQPNRPPHLPVLGALVLPPINNTDIYYVARGHLGGSWVRARIKTVTTTALSETNGGVPAKLYHIVELKQMVHRTVNGRQCAYGTPSTTCLQVGRRVIALFREVDGTQRTSDVFYPGIVAEPPMPLNRYRYLIFFDIGYAQYVVCAKVFVVFESSWPSVWQDLPVNCRPFIRKYLETTHRPMVKLQCGQTVNVEYNGKWTKCSVKQLDCSIALVHFEGINRLEWIYRGSSRLGPMFKEEQNALKKRHTGGRTGGGPAVNIGAASIVQYTKRMDDTAITNDRSATQSLPTMSSPSESQSLSTGISITVPPEHQTPKFVANEDIAPGTTDKTHRTSSRAVARKSTSSAPPKPPIYVDTTPTQPTPKSVSPPPVALFGTIPRPIVLDHSTNRPIVTASPVKQSSKIMYFTPKDTAVTQRILKPHRCSAACLSFVKHTLDKLRVHNPLSKPLLCGWARLAVKSRGCKEVVYKTPCARMLRTMSELHDYLLITHSEMSVDLFDFNPNVRCLAEFSVERLPNPRDLSRGLEMTPIPVVNGINDELLSFSNYVTRREPMHDVPLNTDPDFLVCCDCEDDCRDKSKCDCWKLTLEGAKYMGSQVDVDCVGYVHRRLYDQVLTGIYECNSRCKCASTCLNRVVQNNMSVKLQVFKTHNRGWGIRCVNDIPQGAFICIYAGTIHTEQMANEDGKTYGDEYFAELDYIENCERHKEDYEECAQELTDDEDDDKDEKGDNTSKSSKVELSTADKKTSESDSYDKEVDSMKHLSLLDSKNRRSYDNDDDDDFLPPSGGIATRQYRQLKDDGETKGIDTIMKLRKRHSQESKLAQALEQTVNTKPSAALHDRDVKITKMEEENDSKNKDFSSNSITISDDEDDPKEILSFNPENPTAKSKIKYASVRSFFGEDEPYIMDTKNAGNIGRFLNHSCSPNVFVQNVFVDTHDVRFPWVAFFSSQTIRAGTELTWNYNYDIGSVPGRVLYCYCGSEECKGRLL